MRPPPCRPAAASSSAAALIGLLLLGERLGVQRVSSAPVATISGKPARYPRGLHEVGDGVHAWFQPNGGWGEVNAVLVVGDGESLLVDSLWTPALAREMLDAIEPLTAAAPIRRLVNTHVDGDHWWGNQEVAARAGDGLEIVATEATADEMGDITPQTMGLLRRGGQALGAAGQVPLPVPGRATARAMGAFFESMIGRFDFGEVELTPATRTFTGTLELDVGGRRVELIEVGPAHASGDLIVNVPDARVVAAGDVLFAGVTPIMWAGSAERWIAAIERIAELDPRAIVPGHGPAMTPADAREHVDYFRFVDAAARRRFAAGDSVEEAAFAILALDEFRTGPWAEWDEPPRIVGTLNSIRRAAGGELRAPGAPERMRVFRTLARVDAGVGAAA